MKVFGPVRITKRDYIRLVDLFCEEASRKISTSGSFTAETLKGIAGDFVNQVLDASNTFYYARRESKS
jgi:hypothetical protein